jgi:hypothetical protein
MDLMSSITKNEKQDTEEEKKKDKQKKVVEWSIQFHVVSSGIHIAYMYDVA